MTREQIIQILEEDAREFDEQARVLEPSYLADVRRRHAAALREAVEIVRGEGPE